MPQGEALLGLEAISVCGLDEGDVVINVESGHYGEGNRYFIEKYGGKAIPVETPWNTVVEPEQLEAVLKAHPEAKILWLVHCETPCGTQADLETLAKLGKQYGKLVFVDSVSCAGSAPVEVDAWGIDIVSVGSQKVLGAPPGLSALSISEAAWDLFRNVKKPNRYSYFSLLDWKELWLEKGIWPYTTSSMEVAALNAAVSEYLEVGHEEHFRRYTEVSRAARAGVKAMGLELWADTEAHASGVATAVTVPEGVERRGAAPANGRGVRCADLRQSLQHADLRQARADRPHGQDLQPDLCDRGADGAGPLPAADGASGRCGRGYRGCTRGPGRRE